jgi:hypothetical protein
MKVRKVRYIKYIPNRFTVRFVCRENGSERNAFVGAFLFFAHSLVLSLSIARGLSM